MSRKDPLIEHLKLESKTRKLDQLDSIEDEIFNQVALEGLAGVTLTRLSQILNAIHPSFNCLKDKSCLNHIWSVLTRCYLRYPEDVGIRVFFSNPKKTSESSVVNTRNKATSDSVSPPTPIPQAILKGPTVEKPLRLPQQTIQRLSKIDSLYPIQDRHVMGSCRDYLTRVEITDFIKELASKFGAKPQEALKELKNKYSLDHVFFVAGQLARMRLLLPNWADPNVNIKLREFCTLELIGKTRSLGVVFPNDKTLGRYRIMLMSKGFIGQYQETNSSPIEHHINRYSRPSSGCLNLTTTTEMINGVKNNEHRLDSSSDDEIRQSTKVPLSKLCCNPNKLKPDRSTLALVYDVIAESENGLTQLELRHKLLLPKFHIRNHLKNLLSLKMICSHISKNNDSPFRVFRTAHKSVRRKKKKKELVIEAKGIMAKWDERDLRAKKIIGHKRSSFSQAEDSLLILCRITSLLIEPNLKLSWCVHKRLVRDILHEELVESHDKTSDACLRRIKYLKRLTNNIMSINELTAELRDDQDISRLTKRAPESKQPLVGDERLNKFFIQMLKLVRNKTPNLLGLTSDVVVPHIPVGHFRNGQLLPICSSGVIKRQLVNTGKSMRRHMSLSASGMISAGLDGTNVKGNSGEDVVEIQDHRQLKRKFDLVDCQSIVTIKRARLYEPAKNKVDERLNTVRLVTMAFNLTNCLSPSKGLTKPIINLPEPSEPSRITIEKPRQTLIGLPTRDEIDGLEPEARDKAPSTSTSLSQSGGKRRPMSWLLDKFYSGYHDKLISSVLSNLNKRSLLTRKCGPERASLFKSRAKMSLKLNQSVLFLLNRHQSSSLMQLAHPISQLYRTDLNESNEMASIALLTCLCSANSFNLDLELKIPSTVVGIDQGNENFKSLCEKANERTREVLARFMSRCGTINSTDAETRSEVRSTQATRAPPTVAKEQDHNSISDPLAPGSSSLAPTKGPANLTVANKMDDSRRALFLLRHELKAHALDKCGSLSDCLIVQPCNVRFSSSEQLKCLAEPLQSFLDKKQPVDLIDDDKSSVQNRKQQSEQLGPYEKDKWLVRSFRLPGEIINEQTGLERDLETNKVPIEFSARLWKQIDGTVHLQTLFKLIESLLSWIIMFPGLERDLLEREFEHLLPSEHMLELLHLMVSLKLIESFHVEKHTKLPRLFGYKHLGQDQTHAVELDEKASLVCYQSEPTAYARFCQLLNYCHVN